MNRNEGGHSHHKSGYNRNGNKHQYQNQQHSSTYVNPLPSHHQIGPFSLIQSQPLVQPQPAMAYLQHDPQQIYLNNYPHGYLPNVSHSQEINQGMQMNYNQIIPHSNTMIPSSHADWFNPTDLHTPSQTLPRSTDQKMAISSLSQLQLPADQITNDGIIPNAPYYELPAGLMVPLIGPTQREYKPLDPDKLRLPLPKFPDEEFLRFIDSYYGSDGKARDNDGWDREFVNTFICQKAALAESQLPSNN